MFISRATSAMGLACGTLTQPWRLTGRAGQKIRLTLIDFNSGTSVSIALQADLCKDISDVIDVIQLPSSHALPLP